MDQQIQFCSARDGVRLAYAISGSGPPLVKAANWLTHLEYDWESPVWRHWLQETSQHHTLVRYDERGCGLSDWEVDDFSFSAWVEDLATVVDAAGLERFALLGISQGGAVAIDYAIRHPGRVSHLVLYGAFAQGRARRQVSPAEAEKHRALHTAMRVGWGWENPAFRQVFSNLFMPEAAGEQLRALDELQRKSTSPENALKFYERFGEIDVLELLPQVRVPTLVLHANEDARVPFDTGRQLAAMIPDARFVSLESKNHILIEGEPAWQRFVYEVFGFLGTREPGYARGTSPSEQAATQRSKSPRSPETSAGVESLAKDMSSCRQVEEIFERALEVPKARRSEWIVEVCRGDRAPLEEVQAMLKAHDRSKGILEPPFPAPTSGHSIAGQTISHYRIIEALGEGGMGVVYKATDTRLDRRVALKFLATYLLLDREGRERFHREAKAAASLNHPNICTVYEIDEADGRMFIAMEFVEGESFKHRTRSGPLETEEVLDLTIQAAQGLHAAHEKGITHRDIKSANIMVTPQGQVKLMDFGLAQLGDHSQLTKSGSTLGTPAYMSPEQALGKKTDHRTDLWSLGVVFYELIVGQLPFKGELQAALAYSIVNEDPELPTALHSSLPTDIDRVIGRALAKDREGRYQGTDDLLFDLRSIKRALELGARDRQQG